MSIIRAVLAIAALSCGLAACCKLPTAQAPPAKTAPTCTFPTIPAGTPGLPGGPVTGGTFTHSGSVTIGASAVIDLTSDLVIWSDGDLTIDGTINLPDITTPGAPSVNITLGARGKITINGFVGYGTAAPGAPATGNDAFGGAGSNGGLVKLKSGRIEIGQAGKIIGNGGGWGGGAVATGVAGSWWGLLGTGTPDSNAVGGSGGHAGDVILCADLVTVSGALWGGWGGAGRWGDATAAAGGMACACGGDSGQGGDVIFAIAQVDIKPGGDVQGGNAWYGGMGTAAVTAGDGGDATASGGRGAAGGTVLFVNNAKLVTPPPPAAKIKSGTGGDGGDADATGGAGTNLVVWPGAGGDARATAGNGGLAGKLPAIPLASGATVPGAPGTGGKGGNATALGGNGGSALWLGNGASSGSATATGGANGAGTASTGGTPSVGATTTATATGGVAAPASQPGAP